MNHSTNERIAVLSTSGGISLTTYATRVALVIGEIGHGSLGVMAPGDSACWASDAHLAAVNLVIDRAMIIRGEIERQQESEEDDDSSDDD